MAVASPDTEIDRELLRARHLRWAPWLALGIALAVTLVAWSIARNGAEERGRTEFDYRVGEVVQAVQDRLSVYRQILLAGASLLAASGSIEREQWHVFVDHLQLEQNYPGVLGLGFSEVLPAAARSAHEARVRAQGFPEYHTWPVRGSAEFSAIVFLEPFNWRNRRAFGFDMMSDPERRAAMLRARDSGDAAVTGKVTLVQETGSDVQAGFLMYHPVYRHGETPADVSARRARLHGFVYSPFRMRDLMRGIFGPRPRDLALRIYDGPPASAQTLMFESEDWRRAESAYTARLGIDVYGRDWTVHMAALPGFGAGFGHRAASILTVGALGSLLLFAVSWSLVNTRSRAVNLAERMTARLRERKAQLREITSSLGEGVLVFDTEGRVSFVNPAASELLGWSAEELLGAQGDALLHEHRAVGAAVPVCAMCDALARGESYRSDEEWFRRKNGTRVPVSLVANPMMREGRRVGSVIALRDIRDRREVEAALRQSEQFRALFNYSREAWLLLEADGRVADANPVAGELLGYDRHKLIGVNAGRFMRSTGEPLSFVDVYRRLRGGGSLLREEIYLKSDGSGLPVESMYSLVEHEDRKLFLVAARDMTERKRSEHELKEAMQALERARREAELANEQLARSNLELLRLAQLDGLTGVANRRYFDEYLRNEWRRATRTGQSIALILADLDHFKAYNDYYGHQEGDDCLRRVTAAIGEQLSRAGDLLARYGGEEFALILPETPLEGARRIAENLKEVIAGLGIPHASSSTADHVTLSLGVAAIEAHPGLGPEALIELADRALYRAKAAGRNRVEVHDPGPAYTLLPNGGQQRGLSNPDSASNGCK